MCKTEVITGVLIVFVGLGLPVGLQAEGADDGVVAIYLLRKRT